MTLEAIRSTLLRHLADAIDGHGAMAAVDPFLSSLPDELALVLARTTLPELLTTAIVLQEDLPDGVLAPVLRAIGVLPASPFADRRGAMSDYASALLLEAAGIVDVTSRVIVGTAWPPPHDWPEFGEWAADAAALAVLGLTVASDLCRTRGADLAWSACLAGLENRSLTAARVLRWVPFADMGSGAAGTLHELASFLDRIHGDRDDIRFHLAVARSCVGRQDG